MHHSESAGDPASIRKMAHPAIFPRRGSNTGSSNVSASALTTAASASVSNNIIPTDDYQSPLVIQPPPPAGSSSPGPQHHPQSLNLLSQSQLHSQNLQAGAQVKKKSGFQITSVTPAQISVSTNNSIAEDTESCDDLDESHTEDLSSSEILDVSLSRATDMGGPERSSSEETLNNFHEAESPGVLSPNQPPHLLSHGSQDGPMVNGTAHHHPHQQHSHSHHPNLGHHRQVPPSQPISGLPVGGGVSIAGVSTSGALSGIAQKLPAGLVAPAENTHVVKPATLPQPVPALSSGTAAPSMPAVSAFNMVNPSISNISDVNMLRSSGGSLSAGLVNAKTACAGMDGGGLNANLIQQQSATQAIAAASGGSSGVMRPGAGGVAPPPPVTSAPPQQAPAPAPNPAPAPAPASTISRFRVVKLDSNSEPYKKGRWTCAEYYDKEALPLEGVAPRQPIAEGGNDSVGGGSVALAGHHNDNAEAQQAFQPPAGVQNPLQGGLLKPAAAQPIPSAPGLAQHHHALVNQGAQQQPALAPQQQQLGYAPGGQSAQTGYPPSAQQPPPPAGAGPQMAPAAHTAAATAQHQQVVVQAGLRAPHHPHPPPHTVAGAALPSAGGQPVVSAAPPSAPQAHLPQCHQQQPAPQAPPAGQAPNAPQPRLAPVPAEQQQQLPPRTQCPGSLPPPASAAATLSHVAPAGLPLERKPSPAQFTSTRLEDAQRFLFQHQSLLSLPKFGAGECATRADSAPGLEDSSGASALPAGAGLFPLKTLPVDGEEDSSSGASVVAIDNKIEQAMDLVKSHLMYAVREEVEVLKEQIKELIERNSQLEQENNLLKNLASPEQLAQFQAQVQSGSSPPAVAAAGPGTTMQQQQPAVAPPPAQTAAPQSNGLSA